MVWGEYKAMLMLGDCYNLIQTIPNNSVDLVYVDIPYLYNLGGGGNSSLAKRMAVKKEALSKISNGIDYTILDEFVRICKAPYMYIWCSKLQLPDILLYMKKYNLIYDILVWCKSNPSPTTKNVLLPDIEFCLMFREPKTTKFNEDYKLASHWYHSATNTADKKLYNHPTIKPLQLVKRHILHSTQPGDTVLDCFMGSGTTGVACVETGRNFIGMEIDENYFNVAKSRIEAAERKERSRLFKL